MESKVKRQFKEKCVVITVRRLWHVRIVNRQGWMKKQSKSYTGIAVGMGGSMEATCGAIIGAVNVLGMINKIRRKQCRVQDESSADSRNKWYRYL